MWSRKHTHCINCTIMSRQHVARGYCSKCYGLVRRLDQARKWDLDKPSTLVGYPYRDDPSKELLSKIKGGYEKQIKARLNLLRLHQEMKKRQLDGIYIEGQLRRLAAGCKTKHKNLLYGKASYINSVFSPEQRLALYGLLNDIEEDIPWHVDLGRIFFDQRDEEV